jgi:hypothetical protein
MSYMSEERPVVVVIVHPTTGLQKSRQVLRWLRWLLPAAMLILSETPLNTVGGTDRIITIDTDSVESGPLSIADALTRDRSSSSARGPSVAT